MKRNELTELAAKQLAADYACNPGDFFGNISRVTKARFMEGYRAFKDEPDFFKMATMGSAVIASVSDEMLSFTTDLFAKADKDNAVSLFDGLQLYALNKKLSYYNKAAGAARIYFLPETPYKFTPKSGYDIRVFDEAEIQTTLYQYRGFDNALMYSAKKERHDIVAVCAVNGRNIIGIAGASNDSGIFWQIGIDILPEFRGGGLASELVSALTQEVFMNGAVPYYGTWGGNIASQNVARKCGYYPAWSELYAFDIDSSIIL